MKAALCTAFGGSDDLIVKDIADPVPGEGEVVVDVKAAALNFFDTLIVRNKYQYKPEPPFSPSAEVAGVVSACGPGVTRFKPGDRVAGYTCFGGARERLAISAELLSPIPDGVDDVTASAIAVTYGTGYYALKDRALLKPGETVAILGASGGAGLAAVELCKLMGATVVAVASSDEKLRVARDNGADRSINYREVDLKTALKSETAGKGVDVVYDCVGAEFAEPALRALAWNGRFLVIGFAGGTIPSIPLNLVLLKSVSVIGVFWGRFTELDPAGHVRNNDQLLAWCADGSLRPRIHGTYPLEDISSALKIIERREAIGKVVLTI